MKKKNSNLSDLLKETQKTPSPPEKDAFWSEFKARAALVPQEAAEKAPYRAAVFQTMVRAAAAVVILAAAGVALQFLGGAEPGEQKVSAIKEVNIHMEYSSVVILEDTDNGGTLVWIAEEPPLS